ncbi:transposase [bacterium]|nr:transposase [bacterium]
MDGAAFHVWAEQVLAPTLEPTDIVVMDNLSVHKNPSSLPPSADRRNHPGLAAHSPDLNPIEKCGTKSRHVYARPGTRTRDATAGHRLRLAAGSTPLFPPASDRCNSARWIRHRERPHCLPLPTPMQRKRGRVAA